MVSRCGSFFTKAAKGIKSLDVQHDKPVVDIVDPRKTVIPIAMASVLFMTWGLAYGLLDVMNYHVRVAIGARRDETALLALGYYLAYLVGPTFIAGPLIKRAGYRLCMFLGIVIVGIGCFAMSFGAASCGLGPMVGAHFVIGIGVSILERSANSYAVNCGPRQHATLRILIAQSMAGVGTVIAPFLANAFVFNPDSSDILPLPDLTQPGKCLPPPAKMGSCAELGTVITFYRGVGAIVLGASLLLAIVFFRTHLIPEVSVPSSPKTNCGWKLWRHPLCSLKASRFWWGLTANFLNLGCQVAFAQFFIEHIKINACASDRWAASTMAIAQSAFVAGRLAAAGLVAFPKVFKPRFVLLAFIAGAVACVGAGISVLSSTAIAFAILFMFMESPSFPMIFESATAGFEEWKPACENLLIISISGGGIFPVAFGKLTDVVGISKAWGLEAACFALVLTYPLALCVVPSYRQAIDTAASVESKAERNESDAEAGSGEYTGGTELRRVSREGADRVWRQRLAKEVRKGVAIAGSTHIKAARNKSNAEARRNELRWL